MTYSQIRRHLSALAQYGHDGAPTGFLPPMRWHTLQCAGVIGLVGGLWVITARGWAVLDETEMPKVRPSDRPVQRQSSRAVRELRKSKEARRWRRSA